MTCSHYFTDFLCADNVQLASCMTMMTIDAVTIELSWSCVRISMWFVNYGWVLQWYRLHRSDISTTCDAVCTCNAHPMPRPYGWTMWCPLWRFSVKFTALLQHYFVMSLGLIWFYQAALQWLGCLPVMEFVVIMDTPCLTPVGELWRM